MRSRGRDTFPIPRIDASLDALAGAFWFTTLDLRSGYFQVPLCPRDAPKTSFYHPQWQLPMACFTHGAL